MKRVLFDENMPRKLRQDLPEFAIRTAQEQKVPYMLILGDREIEARSAAVRRRGAAKDDPQETLSWDELGDRLSTEQEERRLA